MCAFIIDDEIALRLAGAVQLGPNAGIVWLQRAVRQRRPEAAHNFVEACSACGIDFVVFVIDPFKIGAEASDAAEIAPIMGAERAGNGRCGGLPERPVGPLGYKLVFNFRGLWNEYRGAAEFLRNGKLVRVPTLTELETFRSSELGPLEACVTSGGTSTCPQSWKGQLETFDYKTIRYPGHWAQIRTLFELGFMDEHLAARDGTALEPVRLTQELFEQRLAFPAVRDVVLLRVSVRGTHQGRPLELQYDLLDRHDTTTGFTAMERTTAFPAALVAHLQARRLIAPGARPLEVSVPALRYFEELAQHDIRVQLSVR